MWSQKIWERVWWQWVADDLTLRIDVGARGQRSGTLFFPGFQMVPEPLLRKQTRYQYAPGCHHVQSTLACSCVQAAIHPSGGLTADTAAVISLPWHGICRKISATNRIDLSRSFKSCDYVNLNKRPAKKALEVMLQVPSTFWHGV